MYVCINMYDCCERISASELFRNCFLRCVDNEVYCVDAGKEHQQFYYKGLSRSGMYCCY